MKTEYHIKLTEKEYWAMIGFLNANRAHLETLIKCHEKAEYGIDTQKIEYLKSELKLNKEILIKLQNIPF